MIHAVKSIHGAKSNPSISIQDLVARIASYEVRIDLLEIKLLTKITSLERENETLRKDIASSLELLNGLNDFDESSL